MLTDILTPFLGTPLIFLQKDGNRFEVKGDQSLDLKLAVSMGDRGHTERPHPQKSDLINLLIWYAANELSFVCIQHVLTFYTSNLTALNIITGVGV